MTIMNDKGRAEAPLASGEVETLLGFLDYARATLAWKTSGLDADGLNATFPPTTMTLGGLLKHMAVVEEYWCAERLLGAADPWIGVDWDADPDWDWRTASDDTPEYLRRLWQEKVAQSRVNTSEFLATHGLGARTGIAHPDDGRDPSLRWIILHMIEEYARHNGHADLLRESIDGQTGS